MINSVGQQNISSQVVIPQTNAKQNITKPAGYEAPPPAQSSVPPLHEYIKRNQIFNLVGATVIGTITGLLDAKTNLEKRISLNDSVIASDEDKKFLKIPDSPEFPKEATFKNLFHSKTYIETLKNVGSKILILAGALYAGDFLCQKIFNNNKEYEEYYQESLKSK